MARVTYCLLGLWSAEGRIDSRRKPSEIQRGVIMRYVDFKSISNMDEISTSIDIDAR